MKRFLAIGLALAAATVVGALTARADEPPDLSPPRVFTVAVKGAGHGLVTSTPPGLDCKPACKAKFPRKATVVLVATARLRSKFAGWAGACVGKALWCVLSAEADKSVTARFVRAPAGSYEQVANTYVTRPVLNVTGADMGRGRVVSSPPGIDCPKVCSKSFDRGKHVFLRAVPGASRVAWSGPLVHCDSGAACDVYLDTTLDVVAHFPKSP